MEERLTEPSARASVRETVASVRESIAGFVAIERGSAAGFSLQDASQARRDATAAHRTGQQRGTRVQGGRGIGGRGDTAMAAPSGDYGNLDQDANTKKMLAVCVVFLVIVTGIMIFVASQWGLFGGETGTEVGVGAG